MLTVDDVKTLKTIVKEAIVDNNEKLGAIMDEKIEKNNGFIFDEMERYYQMGKKDLKNLERRIDEMENYYRIRKQEESTGAILLKLYEKQQGEINEIKKFCNMV